ncbi:uncharacterized protein EDB91DRAFT_1249420 [Suillus paluster]|uniref:uncharacterized protein n=1 Tax=Suillus paluster TaxID=48578 RepID=UPI001B87B7C5|nr:uncharacterized protein EDB91DRAFT_1249420 [Suillus paluster]KAG1738107.1 hypothetical protein EDB91DRAFT_1249420 [Suillus paluster]
MSTKHPSKPKGKAAVPKPARGLGLNPSGLPAAEQLNITAEQPSMSAFSFNPHEESQEGIQEGWQIGGPDNYQPSYDDVYAPGPSREQGAQFTQPQHASSSTSARFTQPESLGTPFTQPQPPYNNQFAHLQPFLDNHFMQPELFPDGDNNDNNGTSIYEGNTYDQGQFGSLLPDFKMHRGPQQGNTHAHDDNVGTSIYDGNTYDQGQFGSLLPDFKMHRGPQQGNTHAHDDNVGTSIYDGNTYDQGQFGSLLPDFKMHRGPQQGNTHAHNDNAGTSIYDGNTYDQGQFGSLLPNFKMHRGPQQGNTHACGILLPQWVNEAPDRGVGFIDRGSGFIPPATDLMLIRRGEISHEEVVHTGGPARTTKKCNTGATLPRMLYFMPQAPRSVTEPQTSIAAPQTPVVAEHPAAISKTIHVSQDNITHTVKGAKALITWVMFTKHAMTQKRKKRATQFENMIKDSTPHFLEADAVVENFITHAHLRKVSNTLSSTCRKIAQFSRNSIFILYKLFPPQGGTATAEGHRIVMVNKLIWGTDPLLFMHATLVDKRGNITIDAKFQNAFIMAGVVQFVWYSGREVFLGNLPLKAMRFVMALVGSAMHCTLQEQQSAVITVDAFGGPHHEENFHEIVSAFDNLTTEEQVEFDSYLQYVLDVGPSQAGNRESSSESDSE